MRRGFIFTLDVLLAFILVSTIVVGVVTTQINTQSLYQTYMREQSMKSAGDVLTILRTVPLNQLVPGDVIKEWIQNGTLNTTLVSPDMSPLDILATYWAIQPLYPSVDYKRRAKTVVNYVLQRLLPGYGYELVVSNESFIRTSSPQVAGDISTSSTVLSGYSYNRTPRGYVARAYLTKIGKKENIYVVRGSYIEARTYSEDDAVVIRYIIPADAIPSDAVVNKIEWFIEPAWVGSNYEVYLNGILIWSGYVRNNKLISSDMYPRLLDLFTPGRINIFEVRVYRPPYYGGEDGAQYIKIYYTTSKLTTFKLPERIYFEDVKAKYGIKVWKYLFIPGYLKSISIKISVANVSSQTPISLSFMFDKEINISSTSCEYNAASRIKTCYWSNETISSTLFTNGYNYSHISSRYTTIIVRVGNENTYYPGIHLLGDNSYIDIKYDFKVLITPYSIDITEPITLPNLDWTNDVTITFNVPRGALPLWVRFQFPWLYIVDYGEPSQEVILTNNELNNVYLYKHPPNPFIHAFARLGFTRDTYDYKYRLIKNAITGGANTIEIRLGQGYQIQPKNGDGELTYILQAYAGYGEVFPKLIREGCSGYNISYYWVGDLNNPKYILAGTSPYCTVSADTLLMGRDTYAVDDAIIRLFNNLGGDGTRSNPLLIELPSSVTIEVVGMGDIPGLFTPITVTLRIWRES
ncbi:hydrolase [Pyrococcus kukulkanii]|uniref:Hydrolase n=1 Tax=Pyrococcus kukulkanii TaxID=1609559 RepID=A0A127BDV9_9EURY|nr:hydrolase [Pyrococcus kukulkanii]AMM54836.1 hydrolase [Pyrococcus kukulkanii]